MLLGNGALSLITERFTAWVESALLGGWETVLSLKFRMTFVVAFHTTDQEAPGNNDCATLSAVPGSVSAGAPPSRQFPRRAAWILTEVLGWQQGVGTGLKGHRGAWSLGKHRGVWQGAVLQKIDVRVVVPPKCFPSAWEGR